MILWGRFIVTSFEKELMLPCSSTAHWISISRVSRLILVTSLPILIFRFFETRAQDFSDNLANSA
jgi:hypothetical protein